MLCFFSICFLFMMLTFVIVKYDTFYLHKYIIAYIFLSSSFHNSVTKVIALS